MFLRHPKNKRNFKWYFVAFFEDGTVIEQNDDTETGHSTMIDVKAKEKESPLVAFELLHVDGDKKVTVDLTSGAFVVNGIPMEAQSDFAFEPKIDPKTKRALKKFNPAKNKLELCYWREKFETMNAVATVQNDGSINYSNLDSTDKIGRYFIGWKSGEHQAILAVG